MTAHLTLMLSNISDMGVLYPEQGNDTNGIPEKKHSTSNHCSES